MHIIDHHQLVYENKHTILKIYIQPNDTEFAQELLASTKELSKSFSHWLTLWMKNQKPKIKIHTIKIILGSFLVATIPVPSYFDTADSSISSQIFAQSPERFNMSYIYFGHPNTHISKVLNTQGATEVVSPSYFDLDDTGNLQLTSHFNKDFIDTMHEHNIKVVPFLSNHWNRSKGIAALKNRNKLVDDLVQVIQDNDLDGINIDIENVTHLEREMYVDLVKQLREKLPTEREVSVAVAANPYGWTEGWHGSYDYEELGKYADYLMIMAYDESYYGSDPGPVSSHYFVDSSIQYALEHVPKEKIVLGIAFYGRYWSEELGIAGHGIHLTKIQEMLQTYDHELYYSQKDQSAKAVVTIKEEDPPVIVFGKPLQPGVYTIWYENSESIRDKLQLVQKYNIKGTGNWSLGQETNDVWMYYELWLNGQYFEDIGHSWAKDEIIKVVQQKIMQGISSTQFAPKKTLTRAEAATVMVRAFQLDPLPINAPPYKDVTPDHWAKTYIDTVTQHGIMIGVGNDKFAPDQPLTREEMAMLLYRILEVEENESAKGEKVFSDVEKNRWSENAIFAMNNKQIFTGYPDETFKPSKQMLREELATVISRILNSDQDNF